MNEELIKVPVVELVYRNNTKPSKRYKIVTAKDVHELLVSPFKDTIEHHISTRAILLNGRNQVLGISTVSEGALSYNITDTRFIVQLAALSNCKSLICKVRRTSPTCTIRCPLRSFTAIRSAELPMRRRS